MCIRTNSLGVYLSAVRFHQILEGFEWTLDGDVRIAKMLRFVKRRYPVSNIRTKMAISLPVLQKILPLLPGWPEPALMCHDDRLFAAASVVATCAFLRAGEFLASPSSIRPVLLHSMVSVSVVAGTDCVQVAIPQPKARWWIGAITVTCFGGGASDDAFAPVRLLNAYRRRSSVPLRSNGPAFVRGNGATLSKAYMLQRTTGLLSQASIRMVDGIGQPTAVKAASWRAGGVRSAVDAGLNQAMIRAMGRWRSDAWLSYLSESPGDLRRAAALMWQSSLDLINGCVVGVRRSDDDLQAEVPDSLDDQALVLPGPSFASPHRSCGDLAPAAYSSHHRSSE